MTHVSHDTTLATRHAANLVASANHSRAAAAVAASPPPAAIVPPGVLDPLTGLMSRAAWSSVAAEAQQFWQRDRRPYGVIAVDVDHFAMLNDARGRPAGDECLNRLARRLEQVCRATDAIGRYSGEEFVVLARDTDAEGAAALAERIRQAAWDLRIPHPASPVAERVTICCGVAGAPAQGWEDVLKRAEEALYVAKTLGRNMVWGQAAPRAVREAQSPGSGTTIVVIDDDAGDAELLRRSLAQMPGFHFDFRYCGNTQVGRAVLRDRPASVVFLDHRLGAEDGLEALREIRLSGFLGPIIAVTGQGDENVVADLMRSGADDYIAKADLCPSLLRRAIRNAENQHLRRKIEARNRQLLSELQSAKRSLERKNRRLTELYRTAHQFVDNVSHEFRTPLTVIKEFTSILRDGLAGAVTDQQREYLDIVLNRTDDLSTMVDDMLDISKLEAGVLGVWRRDCRMADVVQNVRTTLERKAAAAKVELAIDLPDGLPPVYCDPEKIGRVLINLTVNAVKFCNEGGHVRVALSHAAGEHQVRVCVTDDGPGIAPENLQAIFERFKQVEGQVRSSSKGFGLGLSIARELVDLHFGEITVESRLGHGSTFAFTVPTAEPAAVLARYLQRLCFTAVSLLEARVAPGADTAALEDVDGLLQRQLRRSDLLFRAAPTRWLIVAPVGESEVPRVKARVERARGESNRNRPSRALPPIELRGLGTWCGRAQTAELARRFEAELCGAGRAPN